MIYLPQTMFPLARDGYQQTAIWWAAHSVTRKQRPYNPKAEAKLIRGVQARIALSEVFAAIADCEASLQAAPGLSWLMRP